MTDSTDFPTDTDAETDSETEDDEPIESLTDLPDHPTDRVIPGPSKVGHDIVREAFQEAHSHTTENLHGFIAVATTTVNVLAEDAGVAARSAVDNMPGGDLQPFYIEPPVEVSERTAEVLVENYYSENNTVADDYPLFKLRLVGADRFYRWASDGAELSRAGTAMIYSGEFDHCGIVTNWLASPAEVDPWHLAVSKTELDRRVSRDQTGVPEP